MNLKPGYARHANAIIRWMPITAVIAADHWMRSEIIRAHRRLPASMIPMTRKIESSAVTIPASASSTKTVFARNAVDLMRKESSMPGQEHTLLPCPQCQAKNRLPTNRVHDRPKCGRCGAPLNPRNQSPTKPIVITDRNFDTDVLGSPLPVLLDCWAPWCGPCRMVGPIIDELAREWSGRVRVAKMNTDENPQTAGRFQIRSIPTLLVFNKGQLQSTMVGALPKQEIQKRMAPYL
jgi:thioredoxin